MTVLFETERLRLRRFTVDDVTNVLRLTSDAEVMRYIGEGKPMNRIDAWRNMAAALGHWHLRGYGLWAVEEKQSGTLIGRIGLINPDGWPGIEAGWMLRRAFWGKGFATEGARAALQFGFEQIGLDEILSMTVLANEPSWRVMERIGMTRDLNGDFDHPRVPDGHRLKRHILYRLKRANWRPR